MVHRSRPSAKAWRMPNGAGHEMLRQRNRLVQRSAERQMRRQRRGKSASGSVRMTPGDSRGRVVRENLSVVQRDRAICSESKCPPVMTTYTGPSAQIRRAASRRSCSVRMVTPDSTLRLRNVRGHDVRAADQFGLHRHESFVIEQWFAAGRDDHGIDDEERNFQIFDCGSNRLDDRRIGEHAGLGSVYANVRHTASICAVTRSAASAVAA